MNGKRELSMREKDELRAKRRAELADTHPGVKFHIYIADETDDYGKPLVLSVREDDEPIPPKPA